LKNVNFAYVRSSIALILAALALLLAAAPAAGADTRAAGAAGDEPSVIIATLPSDMTIAALARVEGLSPGLLSSGIGGGVPAAQTYLDMSQGARVFSHFYDEDLPPVLMTDAGVDPKVWDEVVARAESAPDEIVPGLLAQALEDAGVPVAAEPLIGHVALLATNESGAVERMGEGGCLRRCPPGMSVVRVEPGELPRMIAALDDDDMLLAIRDAPPDEAKQLPIGIAGTGFDGTLTSDSTRTEGFVISTDIAPTILDRLGIEVPPEMDGEPIRSEEAVDIGEITSLDRRLGERPGRGAVIGIPLLVWLALTGLAAWIGRARLGRPACAMLALSGAYLPTMLLVGAALKPSQTVEALIVLLGSPALAAITLRLVRGYAALAVACAITVGAHAIDMFLGSPLTALSVLGPNPAGGVRFYGIGNELEAGIAAMVPIGVGAWLGSRPDRSPRFAAAMFFAFALLATLAFAPGRFGADVGAAIVLPVGAVVAAGVVLELRVRTMLIGLVLIAIAGVAALVLADTLSGGGSHFARTVLGADNAGELWDVVERRVRLTARSFYDPRYPYLLVICIGLLAIGWRRRDQLMGWFGDRHAARAGFLGALVATIVGTLANDSGAILLIVGTIYIAIAAGFFWARSPAAEGMRREE
jgi:hypothetical protein